MEISLMLGMVLCLASAAQGQATDVVRDYDRFRDISSVSLAVGDLQPPNNPDVMILSLCRAVRGKTMAPIGPKDPIYLNFHSRSRSWKFLKHRDVYVLTANSRYQGKGTHEGDVIVGSSVHVSEDIAVMVDFVDLDAISRSPRIEIAIGGVEVELKTDQREALKRFVDRLRLDEGAILAAQAVAQVALEERVFELFPTVYPAAKTALVNAKNRGSGAPVATRKAAVAREIARAAKKLCEDFKITRQELDEIVKVGESKDGTAYRRLAAIAKAKAKDRAKGQNGVMLDAIGQQVNRAAQALPGSPGGAPALPGVNNTPIR
jgi:hypothetical protein